MKYVIAINLAIVFLLINTLITYAESSVMVKGSKSLDVELKISPSNITPDNKINFDVRFLKKGTNQTQEHIDYVFYIKDPKGNERFRTPLTHTNEGEIVIPHVFDSQGTHTVVVEIYGINFTPIPKEVVEFNINVVPEFPFSVLVILFTSVSMLILLVRKYGF